jgi:hypothetical protein
MPVILGDNSISIGGKLLEIAKSQAQYPDPNATGEPTVTVGGTVTPVILDNDYKYMRFTTIGSYTVNFPESKVCSILIVGGGGAGGVYIGGGGGAGGVLHITSAVIPSGNYTITVGKGGNSVSGAAISAAANNGSSSIAFGIEVFGGGFGGAGQWANNSIQNGSNGGSGGGAGASYNVTAAGGGSSKVLPNFSSSSITVNSYVYYGGNGAAGIQYNNNMAGAVGTNGGGGASGNAPANTNVQIGGPGADGVQINIDGNNYFWGGGGGGGLYGGTSNGKAGDGGKGGGGGGNGSQVPETVGIGGTGGITNGQNGDPEGDGTPTAGSGGANTGGGGGGTGRTAGSPNAVSGAGGSGIVIIRYLRKKIPIDAQWTYNTSNANVYRFGNVGIGIANPTNTLEVIGNTHSTTYSAGKKTFKIEHPLKLNKWLYHGCIEGPRFDNIYRGKKLIIEGKAEVDIDKECNTTGGMTSGTFTALNTNHQLYLQNNQTYDIVKGTINNSIITIECENTTDEIEVDWLVVGERHDEHVINTPLTDSDGNLICEHEMPEYINANDVNTENIPVTNIDISDESITDVTS